MVFRMFAAALVAGLLSAVLITGLQALITTPMILQAETYEVADPSHDHGAHEHGQVEWKPAEGTERMLYTLLANCGAGVGFALLLVVGLSFDMAAASAVRGVIWGMAGFGVFTLAPSLGLPPGAPGMPAPDEQASQIWWLMTVGLSGVGIAAMVFGSSFTLKALGMVLLVMPHFWGAPPLMSGETQVPANLAVAFSASSMVLSAVFWIVIGYLSGLVFARLGRNSAQV